jgi:hypothetical protein
MPAHIAHPPPLIPYILIACPQCGFFGPPPDCVLAINSIHYHRSFLTQHQSIVEFTRMASPSPIPSYVIGSVFIGFGILSIISPKKDYEVFGLPLESPSRTPSLSDKKDHFSTRRRRGISICIRQRRPRSHLRPDVLPAAGPGSRRCNHHFLGYTLSYSAG